MPKLKPWFASLFLVALMPLAVRAGGVDQPTAVVRVRSLDTLVENVKLLVTLAGREEIAKQVEGLVKAKIGVQGLEGIDPARPFGAYARFGTQLDDISGAVLIPIANEKAFLALLENLNFNATKGKGDIYTVQTGAPVDVYLRFANNYAYVTALNAAALEGKLVDPVAILGKDGPTFNATVRLDQLPDAARQLAIGQIQAQLQDVANKKAEGETAGQQAVRVAAVKEISKTIVSVIKDGGPISLTIDLNAASKELSASLTLAGKKGSDLAQSIEKLGQEKSLFGAWRDPNAAFRGLTHVILPDEIKQSFNKLLDEGIAQSLANIQDAGKRDQAKQLLDVLSPTLKGGELDAGIQLIGPGADQKYAIIAGVKVADGVKLGGTLHDLVADALKQIPEAQRSKIKLNHDAVGAVKIHRLELPDTDEAVRKLRDVVGDNNLYVAFKNDTVLVAIGSGSLDKLKEVLAGSGTGASPLLLYEVDVARLAPIVAPTEELRAAAKKVFADKQDGLVRLSLEGGASLRLNVSTRLAVVQFLSQTRELKGGN